jgi:hypothetical protein
MILNDNEKNTEFLYLYVEKFKWSNQENAEAFAGHPKPKSVYRAILNKDTNGYRILYSVENGTGNAVIINSLNSDSEDIGFTCKIHTITRNNILDFDISEEDLDKLSIWTEKDNQDLKNIMKGNTEPFQQIDILDEEASEFFACALDTRKEDPLLFDAIHEYMHHLLEQQPDISSLDTTWLNMSPKFGTGSNISKAIDHIKTYVSENRRTNLDEKDLFHAITHLLNEINQRRFNS